MNGGEERQSTKIVDDNDDLSTCERGDVSSTAETGSLTLEDSLHQSFSNDTDIKEYPIYLAEEGSLRHRREHLSNREEIDPPNLDDDAPPAKKHNHTSVLLNRRIKNILFITALAGALLLGFLACLPSYQISRQKSLSRLRARKIIRKIERQRTQQSQFSVLLKGSRVDLLHQSLDYHTRCPAVGHVYIEWKDDDPVPESLFEHRSGKVDDDEVTSKMPSDAVLLLDEGIHFTCDEIQRAFREWQQDPVRMVGLSLKPCRDCQHGLVSDAAAFVHRLFLDSRPTMRNNYLCQHLALSAQLTSVSSKIPILIMANPELLDSNDQEDMMCIPKLQKAFGLKTLPRKAKTYVGRS